MKQQQKSLQVNIQQTRRDLEQRKQFDINGKLPNEPNPTIVTKTNPKARVIRRLNLILSQSRKLPFFIKTQRNRKQSLTNNMDSIEHSEQFIKIFSKANRQSDTRIYDNNRKSMAMKQLQLWQQVYTEPNVASTFFADLLYAFQDYQYLYLVTRYTPGHTLDVVFKQHTFSEEQTKYIVAALIVLIQYFHEQGYALTELAPEHLLVEAHSGKLKLLQILNPMPIDCIYQYTNITPPNIYSAPQILAKTKVRAQSDFYTVGTFMYQMMTQKKILSAQLQGIEQIERHHIMKHNIELKKYNLPEGWNPEAADFLVKLLIKNPLYRLGRYGSFELRFHPWMQNYNWDLLTTRNGINLNEPFFCKNYTKEFPINQNNFIYHSLIDSLLHDTMFLRLFEKYDYRRSYSQSSTKTHKENLLQQQFRSIKGQKSEKYYDIGKGQHSNSSEDIEEEQYRDNLEVEDSESIGKSESMGSKKQPRKGLLNIIPKNN